MKEVKTEARTYIVRAYCDCGGEYTPDGMVLTSNPPQFPHHCSDCGDKSNLKAVYPRTVVEEVEPFGSVRSSIDRPSYLPRPLPEMSDGVHPWGTADKYIRDIKGDDPIAKFVSELRCDFDCSYCHDGEDEE